DSHGCTNLAFRGAGGGTRGGVLGGRAAPPAAPRLIKDINPGPGNAFNVFSASLTNVNGTLFFPADDGVHGRELWKSDGTRAGTVLVKDFSLGEGDTGIGPFYLTDVNGTLFFSLTSGPAEVRGLWKSDGTDAGTVRVSSVNAQEMADVNGALFFLGGDAEHGQGLWKSDGTDAGTVFLKSVTEAEPAELVNVNGTLFFNGSTLDQYDRTLWKSDGTPEGTVPVDDADLFDSYPENLTNVNRTLLLHA